MDADTQQALDDFLLQHQNKAYKMAVALTHNRDDALELLQDSMLQLVQSYAQKPAEQWPLLFYRILQNRIRDFHRKQGLRRLFNRFKPIQDDNDDDAVAQSSDVRQPSPEQHCQNNDFHQQLLRALATLPLRQQQIFLLRAWQEFSTRETAWALGISPGSVKTHYSRAIRKLREQLGDRHATL